MNIKKVSVIIPVYNTEQYLQQCLESVINQTLKEIEIICINDGSSDNSLNILRKFNVFDNRIIIIEQDNKGAGVARNEGIKIASGEYLYFLDSDDYLEPEALEILFIRAKKNNLDILIFYKISHFDNTGEMKNDIYHNIDDYPEVFSINNIPNIYDIITTTAWDKFFNHKFINRNQLIFQDLKSCNDLYFTLKAVSVAERISIIDENLINYRIGHTQNITTNRGKYSECIFIAFNKLLIELKDLYNKNNILKQSFLNKMMHHYFYEYDNSADKDIFINLAIEHLPKECTRFLFSQYNDIKKLIIERDDLYKERDDLYKERDDLYKENSILKNFNNKIKNMFIYKLYSKIKIILNGKSRNV